MRKFKLYPVIGDRRYYLVYIFRTRAQMHWHRDRLESRFHDVMGYSIDIGSDFEGCCTWWDARANRAVSDPLCVGFILLHLSWSGVGVVTHELGHAAVQWMKFIYTGKYYDIASMYGGFDGYDVHEIETKKDAEEYFCYLLGDIAKAYWRGWWRHADRWAENVKSTPQSSSG